MLRTVEKRDLAIISTSPIHSRFFSSSLSFSLSVSKEMALTLPNAFLQRKLHSPLHLPPLSTKKSSAIRSNRPEWSCRKKDIHPKFYENGKVFCNGELVMTTGGTQEEYVVDVWSGNHPFYLGSRSKGLVDDDQVEKFRKKFGELSQLMEIPVLKGEIILPPKRKASGKGGKKK
ncbi:60S ribosomal protein L31 [Sarracenia purpurea var. burkii]